MSLEHCGGCLFLAKFVAVGLDLARNEAWVVQKHYAFCDGVLGYFQLSRILVSLIFNFFSHLLF